MKNQNSPFQLKVLLAATLSCGRGSKTTSIENISSPEALYRLEITPPANLEELPYIYLSSLADDIEYVKLETRKDVLLNYGKVFFNDQSKYMVIRDVNQLYLFGRNGEFIIKIGRVGRGPNEFVPHLVSVDFRNEIMYLL